METNNKPSTSLVTPNSSDEDDVHHKNFQEISDYRDASIETTSKLVEEFKFNNANNSTTKICDDNNATTIKKVKKRNKMLTTPDKLRRTPTENENTFNHDLTNHRFSNFSFDELFSTGRPSRHFTSLFSNKSLVEELKTSSDNNNKKEKNDQTIEVDKSFLELENIISQTVICPEFYGFVAEHDKIDNSNDDQLNGIEYHFNPKSQQFLNNSDDSICDEPKNNKLDSCSNDKNTTVLDELLECIDHVKRDYSYFNPKLLANWKGPKEWKAQEMMKALKSCTPNERINLILNINDNIDESTQQNIKQILDKYDLNKKMVFPHTLQMWDSLENQSNSYSIVSDVIYKIDFLKYIEIKPEWSMYYKIFKENSSSEASNSYQNSNDCSQTIVDNSKAMQIDDIVSEMSENKGCEKIDDKLANLDASEELIPEDVNIIANIKTESVMDIVELKKEISDIIDEQCVETDPNSKWSSSLSFFNLLTMLHVNERYGLSIPIVYIGLLHLANERGLKLLQENCVINDMKEIFIAKPMNKE